MAEETSIDSLQMVSVRTNLEIGSWRLEGRATTDNAWHWQQEHMDNEITSSMQKWEKRQWGYIVK